MNEIRAGIPFTSTFDSPFDRFVIAERMLTKQNGLRVPKDAKEAFLLAVIFLLIC